MSQNEHQLNSLKEDELGIAGKTTRYFIKSPLSPLLYLALLLMGIMGYLLIPRQEDPQISVPMIDLTVNYPGASAEKVSTLAIEPLERIMSEITGVKHVYSASIRGWGMVTIQFEVGEEMESSLVKVNDKLDSNRDRIPPGVQMPFVKAVGIDDVPIVSLTFWSEDLNNDGRPDVDDSQLRMLAHEVLQQLKQIKNTSRGMVIGGRREVVKVEVLPEILAGYGISMGQVAKAIQSKNTESPVGSAETGGKYQIVVSGSFIGNAADIGEIVISQFNGLPIRVRDVAHISHGPEDATSLVSYYTGAAANHAKEEGAGDWITRVDGAGAVTIALAKKKGSNGVTVADDILQRIEELKGRIIPTNVRVAVTRNYGKTAKDKVNALLLKLVIATGLVTVLVLFAFRAFKPAIVVTLVIPVVLLMTIFVGYIWGMTIDRVSLFALIFSIGILVDDAIVVIENIYRRWLESDSTSSIIAIDAVREVGNPTILATFTVIAALLPMAFVSGMMGPYMAPIPKLGSVAMLISLFAAFVFTPWMARLDMFKPSMKYLFVAEKREHKEAQWLDGLYRGILTPMIENPALRRLFNGVLWLLLLLACSMFYFKSVAVKMLPLDNKPEFTVVLDMPEGTALPDTANVAAMIAEDLRNIPEVTALQTYVGIARPFDFNGMVRHYYLRSYPWQAEVQVQLLDKAIRKKEKMRTSHDIAVDARARIQKLLKGVDAVASVVEMPPGPPVLQSVVAEVHGPDAHTRRQVASDLTQMFKQAESLRDVDNYMAQETTYWRFETNNDKAQLTGITQDMINQNLAMALGSVPLGDIKNQGGKEPVSIMLQLPFADRSQVTRLGDLPITNNQGHVVPLRELGHFVKIKEDPVIYHKDLRGVEYVVADVGGTHAAPVYGMMQVERMLDESSYVAPDGSWLINNTNWMGRPDTENKAAFEWAGEWTVTYETFRDMGAAFIIALALIYFLVVIEFRNFRIPAVIMAPIPLTLLGIVPAHWMFNAEFTATSMIGWIALAGIIVRNSILLVDFTIHEVQKGMPLRESVINACKTRTRPIVITALALVGGSSVILTDPIFQGMAISLLSGVLVSTILTLFVIPLGTFKAREALYEVAGMSSVDESSIKDTKTEAIDRSVRKERIEPETEHSGKSLSDYALLGWFAVISVVIFAVSIITTFASWLFKQLYRLLHRPKQQRNVRAHSGVLGAPFHWLYNLFRLRSDRKSKREDTPIPVPQPEQVIESKDEVKPETPTVDKTSVEESLQESPTAPEVKTEEIISKVDSQESTVAQEKAEAQEIEQAKDDILQTSQATEEDLDLLSAPIRKQPKSDDEQIDPADNQLDSLQKAKGDKKRRGIRLRDTSKDADDGLN